jgi:hypothetical protein
MRIILAKNNLICLVFVLAFTSCSSNQQNSSVNSVAKNNIKATSESSDSVNKEINIADENFAREWKEKFKATADEIERNRRKWQESKIENYSFEIAKYAGGTTNPWNRLPVLNKIQNGEKTIEKIEKGPDQGMSKTDGFEEFDTIDKLFNYIRKELDNGKIIEAKYHKKFGYPEEVFIIYTFEHNHNSHNIFIKKLEVLK